MRKLWTSPEDIVDLTLTWTGERSSDGRPLVPEADLDALASVGHEQAWDALQARGHEAVFAGGWRETRPDRMLVGRAVTVQFLPYRPDFDGATLVAASLGDGDPPWGTPSEWAVSSLGPGDVMVVDAFGKVSRGAVLGARLAAEVASRTGRGAVVDGSWRGGREVETLDASFFFRETDPATPADVSLAAINGPVRIGPCTVLPGDIVLGGGGGITFIPPHLAHEVVALSSERADRRTRTDHGSGEFAAWRAAAGFSDA